MQRLETPAGYKRLDGAVPVLHPPGMEDRAAEVKSLLEAGAASFSDILAVEPPEIEAILLADRDREKGPRENDRPYPPGLPYFTRAASPPALVLPETLSTAFRPRTSLAGALVIWHELAHAFVLSESVVRTPPWLREFVPQALSAAAARRSGLPLREHLEKIEGSPGFRVRDFEGPADAKSQMAFQNELLILGAAVVERFGDGALRRLAHALWAEEEIVDEERAEELLTEALGAEGRHWLLSRPEF